MTAPAVLKQALGALLDAAFDAKKTAIDAKERGEVYDVSERVQINGHEVKVRVQANDPDHPKEIILRVKWRRRNEDL